MKKILTVFLVLLLSSCSLAFDPAGKLSEKKTLPTGTSTSTPVLQVKHAAASPTAEIKCQATGDLNMRSAPSANAGILDYFHTGDVVTSIGESTGWRQVRNWAGAVGWAKAEWLRCGEE